MKLAGGAVAFVPLNGIGEAITDFSSTVAGNHDRVQISAAELDCSRAVAAELRRGAHLLF